MKRILVIPALACALAVSGCADGPFGGRETVVVSATEWVDPDTGEVAYTEVGEPAQAQDDKSEGKDGKKAAPDIDWASEYAKVLDNPEQYNFEVPNPAGVDVEFSVIGDYNYALVEANGGGHPELLLNSWGTDPAQGRYARVLVFSVDDGSLQHSDQALTLGAAGAGGFRATVEAPQLGRGLYQNRGTSGTNEGESFWCDIDGTTLKPAAEPDTIRLTSSPPLHLLINWSPVADRAALEAGELTVSLPENENVNPVDAPDVVATGTVVKKTGLELSPQGMPNNEDPNSEYFLLQLDSPQEFTDHMHAGEVYTKATDAVSLGMREGSRVHGAEWAALEGQRVQLTMAPEMVHFQTDASMPPGALRVGGFKEVKIL